MTIRLVLASASPARLETLRRAGVRPDVIVSDVDEAVLTREFGTVGTATLTQRLAEAKATSVARQLGAGLVLGCDSMLDLGGEPVGKPASIGDAMERWKQLRGRAAVLHTGHCLIDAATGAGIVTGASTEVQFADLTDFEIALYCASGEPTHVAGGFTIDGLGGWFVRSIRGDHHNVVGLSLPLVRDMLGELGHSLADLGYPAG
ncbi:MAG: nucleoside triphosphate pyrophosphatase [Pseudonocardiales bacterium]|nr:nucleoside triphosphate pyrophosphatase [Pseudonocardiales bacterium]